MNARRMRRPSAVRIGMFCRFGSDDDRRPWPSPPGGRRCERGRSPGGSWPAACPCRCPSAWTGCDAREAASAADSPWRAPAARPRPWTARPWASSCAARGSCKLGRTGSPASCFGEPRLKAWPASLWASILQRLHALAELGALLRMQMFARRAAHRCARCATARAPAASRCPSKTLRSAGSACSRGQRVSCRARVISASSAA
jgi:hypothetical protein